jgi:LacI family transcriptional regulator
MAVKSKRGRSFADKLRVALVIETSSSYGRGLLSGIVRFRQTTRNWSVFLEQRDLASTFPSWLANWQGDGIISRATTLELARAVASTNVPLVELTDRGQDLGFTYIWSDDAAIGKLGAEHLIDRGFQDFAFCGFDDEAWSHRREVAFQTAIQDASHQLSPSYRTSWFGENVEQWDTQQAQIIEWLLSLPKPVAIMACNDVRGQQVLDACSRASLLVPEQVAVLGVDDDALLCQLCDPPLSSIVPNAELIGFRAAELLAQEMTGERAAVREHLIGPIGVSHRQSTDTYAVEDPEVAKALSFIRDRACAGIGVEDVARHVGVSRSTLERKLRRYSNRSPQEHIRKTQIRQAQELLVKTELPIDHIATVCGYEHPEYLHVVFRRELKMTPGEFRRDSQR